MSGGSRIASDTLVYDFTMYNVILHIRNSVQLPATSGYSMVIYVNEGESTMTS